MDYSPAPEAGVLRPPRLLDQMRDCLRVAHYSLRTEKAYVHWVLRYIRYHGRRHPRELGPEHVGAFLSSLATRRNVAPATQNQALAAILFLYKRVLGVELPWLQGVVRAKVPKRLPVVLSRPEVAAMLARLDGEHALLARLMYGTGLRLSEALELRVKDLDFDRGELIVRQGKGAKDRVTMLPASLAADLRDHLARVRYVHEADRAAELPGVELPHAYALRTRRRPSLGAGSGYFRRTTFPPTRARASAGGTMPTARRSSVRCGGRLGWPAS
jgi:integrase